MDKYNKTKKLVIDSILLALLILSSKIVIPIGLVGITLQVFVVLLIILLSDYKNSLFIILSYLSLGIIFQLPVFSSGGGINYIYNPGFGFLLGFIPAIFIIKPLTKLPIKNEFFKILIANILGIIVIYICGYIYGVMLFGIAEVLLPLIIFDIFKAVVATIIYIRIQNII